jgi:hypothetical protein
VKQVGYVGFPQAGDRKVIVGIERLDLVKELGDRN